MPARIIPALLALNLAATIVIGVGVERAAQRTDQRLCVLDEEVQTTLEETTLTLRMEMLRTVLEHPSVALEEAPAPVEADAGPELVGESL